MNWRNLWHFSMIFGAFCENVAEFDMFLEKNCIFSAFLYQNSGFLGKIFKKLRKFWKTELIFAKIWGKNSKTEAESPKTQKYKIFRFRGRLKGGKKACNDLFSPARNEDAWYSNEKVNFWLAVEIYFWTLPQRL